MAPVTRSSKLPAVPTSPPLPPDQTVPFSSHNGLIIGKDYDFPKYSLPKNAPEPVKFNDAFLAYFFNLVVGSMWMYFLVPFFTTSPDPSYMNPAVVEAHSKYYYPLTATFIASYYFIVLILRFLDADAHVFYEQCWACNYVMLVSAYGMLTGQPLFTGLSCVIVCVDQLCWYFDIAGRILTGKYHIGVAKYLSNPQITTTKKLTAWHHLWFLPVMLSTLEWQLPANSFIVGSIMGSSLSLISRPFIPFYCLSEQRDPETQKHKLILLNVNCPYAFWEDIPLKFLHIANHKPWYIYIPYLYLIANFVLNLPAVFIMFCLLMNINGNYDITTFS